MAVTTCHSAFLCVISLLLASCFLVEGSLTRKNELQRFRGSLKKVGVDVDGDHSDDEDDKKHGEHEEDEEDDEESDKTLSLEEQKEDEERDEEDEKKHKEVKMLEHKLADNMHKQEQMNDQIKHLSDEAKSDQEVDASAALVGKETQSPAMGHMLGRMWKEMRMFETPSYAEHVDKEVQHLKHEQHTLEAKLRKEHEEHEHEEHGEHKDHNKREEHEEDEEQKESDGGHEGCRCIGIDGLEGETVATLKDGAKVPYPADLGGRCEAWDLKQHPECKDGSSAPWCKQKWCYVDPCKCKNVGVLPKPSIYIKGAQYKGKPVHFSYATCGGKDSYSSEEEKQQTQQDIAKTCAVKVDSSKWGAETCQCIGISPQPGTTKVNIKDKMVAFPADAGAVCNAWENNNHPECDSDDAPDWCTQEWCYVDPCSCKLPAPPKTSSYLPGSTYQGKPIYFSYATCGGKDSWTSGIKNSCVNQKTHGACEKLDKCAWTGKECLGKELVNVCGLDDKSASWSPKASVALILPLLVLSCTLSL